jgi:SAM-dependent methyltransferase
METWLAFWNAPNRIYVNRRHQEAYFTAVFAKVRRYLPTGGDRVVLDWGCSDALAAGRMAEISGRILLYDGAEAARARLADRYRARAGITVIDDEALAHLAPGSIDLILINSVIQYLSRSELEQLLDRLHRLLRSDGLLLVGDVIEPGTPMLCDTANLLRFAAANGFLVAAVFGLMSTFLSDYRRLRHTLGLSRCTPAEAMAVIGAHGFSVRMLPENIAPNRYRRAFIARPATPDRDSAA